MQELNKGQRVYFKDKNGCYSKATIKSVKDGYANIEKGAFGERHKVRVDRIFIELPEKARLEKLKLDKEMRKAQEILWRIKDGL